MFSSVIKHALQKMFGRVADLPALPQANGQPTLFERELSAAFDGHKKEGCMALLVWSVPSFSLIATSEGGSGWVEDWMIFPVNPDCNPYDLVMASQKKYPVYMAIDLTDDKTLRAHLKDYPPGTLHHPTQLKDNPLISLRPDEEYQMLIKPILPTETSEVFRDADPSDLPPASPPAKERSHLRLVVNNDVPQP